MSIEPGPARVNTTVTTVWIDPEQPRAVDAPIVRDVPDAVEWLRALDANDVDEDVRGEDGDGRLGLHGRVETQLVADEPVEVRAVSADGAWAHIVAPWQPSPKDGRGYPGWVPAAHLSPADGTVTGTTADSADAPVAHATVDLAREHLGLRYLWGGLSPLGLDCSGLVVHVWRRLGVVVPRDAYAQAEWALAVQLDAVEPGDLYFFARPGRRIHHVGIVVEPGRMIHASETGGRLVEESLGPDRIETLVGAGRISLP